MRRITITGIVAISLLTATAQVTVGKAYLDTSLSPRERAESLLKELTLDEKVSLMMDESPAIERLGIPRYGWWSEALHGVARNGNATVFPQAIGMAATFDDDLTRDAFSAISDEARAKFNILEREGKDHKRYGGLTFWTPNVNIFRDPRWGRGQETYGEDPFLTSRMGEAAVRGLQGDDDRYAKTIACAKHYAVHSGPEWNRHSFDARDIDPRDLWETYLPAFKTLVDAGVGQVMCAYNRYEGEPCCSNKALLTDILRNRWGYDKIVVSDCWAINDFFGKNRHETHASGVEASADAVISGTDLECGSVYKNLPEAMKAGIIDEAKIDRSVLRLLETRFRLGELFPAGDTPWENYAEEELCNARNSALALEMARKSMTLLKNNGILPLPKDAKIAVMGPNAADSVMLWGNYNGLPMHSVTILDGIRDIAGDVEYLKGCDLVENHNSVSCFGMLSSDGKPGVSVKYWDNFNREGNPVAEDRFTSPIDKSTGGATVFAPGVPLERFSGIYTADFTPEESGEYIVSITSNKGFREFWLDGEKVLRRFDDEPMKFYSYKFNAEKGKTYPMQINFAHETGTATLKFDIGQPLDYVTEPQADIVIFAGGISPALEGEEMPIKVAGFKGGDRTSIELPQLQRDLIKSLKEKGKKVIFINCSGAAVGLSQEDEICDAILQAWYPGQAGGQAVAEVIYGDYNPAGRLPVTFYRDDNQLPDFEDYSMEGRTYRYMKDTPLYPFGYGLSYSNFKYSDQEWKRVDTPDGKKMRISAKVSNTGKRDGEEVVQVYIRNLADKSLNKTLREFRRIPVKAGESVNVDFDLTPDAFAFYNPATDRMETTPGEYEVQIGGSSEASFPTFKIKID